MARVRCNGGDDKCCGNRGVTDGGVRFPTCGNEECRKNVCGKCGVEERMPFCRSCYNSFPQCVTARCKSKAQYDPRNPHNKLCFHCSPHGRRKAEEEMKHKEMKRNAALAEGKREFQRQQASRRTVTKSAAPVARGGAGGSKETAPTTSNALKVAKRKNADLLKNIEEARAAVEAKKRAEAEAAKLKAVSDENAKLQAELAELKALLTDKPTSGCWADGECGDVPLLTALPDESAVEHEKTDEPEKTADNDETWETVPCSKPRDSVSKKPTTLSKKAQKKAKKAADDEAKKRAALEEAGFSADFVGMRL